MIELLYDPDVGTSLAIAKADAGPAILASIELPNGEVLIPYGATNNLLTSGCIALPSAIGRYESQAALVAEITAFLHRYVDLSPAFEELAAYYVLFSWVYDAFNEAPILRLRGELGSGKSRALLAIGLLCHKSFFASGASTVSPVFHIINAFQGVMALDEADFRFSDSTADLVKILNNGTMRGLPVLRTLTNRHRELSPSAFCVFGPKIIAMREHFADEALESRCITEEMGARPLRSGIPLVTPATLRVEAQALRNDLLAWRFAARHTVAIDPSCMLETLSPRGNQMAIPLLSLIEDAAARERVGVYLANADLRARARRASQPHIAIAGILDRLFREDGTTHVSVSKLAREYSSSTGNALAIKSVGHMVRSQLRLETRKSAGIYVIPAYEKSKVAELMARFGEIN
ncbi:hypothetical protein P1X14_03435 [Sphingomonas sp. AOB5]|uniref:hypothetical protein n=1 Tax=Sphingomonas sp. AOB5 TaxID=3034017 RepID=UPI0023F617F9|nr:hypothetical protein [Sphingomonas sp. AOB5]MDF7774290.1 hypothetical protein [Sphingomonas sp. AOB5]